MSLDSVSCVSNKVGSTTTHDLADRSCALLCSRLCHDMLSPVGALAKRAGTAGGRSRTPNARALHGIARNNRRGSSTDKLKFFRLAFGAAGGFGEAIPIDEAQSVIDALAADAKRVTINWAIAEPSLPKPAVKVNAQSCADCTGCAGAAGHAGYRRGIAATARSRSWRALRG